MLQRIIPAKTNSFAARLEGYSSDYSISLYCGQQNFTERQLREPSMHRSLGVLYSHFFLFRDSLFIFVVNPLDPKRLEEEGSGFLKDLFSLGRLVDVAGDRDLLARSGAGDTGVGGIIKKVSLGEFFRDGSVKVGNVQDDTLDLGIIEALDAEGVLEDESRSLQLSDDLGVVGKGRFGGRRECHHAREGRSQEEGGRQEHRAEQFRLHDLFLSRLGHGLFLL
jgi:hypothetical protein